VGMAAGDGWTEARFNSLRSLPSLFNRGGTGESMSEWSSLTSPFPSLSLSSLLRPQQITKDGRTGIVPSSYVRVPYLTSCSYSLPSSTDFSPSFPFSFYPGRQQIQAL
jgi:hypothetical protein